MSKTEIALAAIKEVPPDISLPFFVDTVDKFAKAFAYRVRQRSRTGVLAEIRGHFIHEGRQGEITRSEGDIDEIKLAKSEASFVLKNEEVERFTTRMRIE
ncbi:hypothetical protein [uncultured Enterovirga sp.]|uniref:hypothetical protein n=1 Tax=uncultured Enterovirga sp. TaxID=2026352 RepID=UPI0035CA670F